MQEVHDVISLLLLVEPAKLIHKNICSRHPWPQSGSGLFVAMEPHLLFSARAAYGTRGILYTALASFVVEECAVASFVVEE